MVLPRSVLLYMVMNVWLAYEFNVEELQLIGSIGYVVGNLFLHICNSFGQGLLRQIFSQRSFGAQ